MSEYNIYPSMDEALNFPEAVRRAIANYPEILAKITKTQAGLGSVDNTTDLNKPISTKTQTALNLKANLASPAFTGTPTGITKAHVGLGSVDNTADTAKPVSTAQRTAIDATAKGLIFEHLWTGVSGATTNAVINNFPTFNFVAGRHYRIVWDSSFYQSSLSDQFLWSINLASIGDAGTALTGLTTLISRARGALAATGFTQHQGPVTAYYTPTASGPKQIKFRVQRTVGSGSITVVSTPTESGVYHIYDDGAGVVGSVD